MGSLSPGGNEGAGQPAAKGSVPGAIARSLQCPHTVVKESAWLAGCVGQRRTPGRELEGVRAPGDSGPKETPFSPFSVE